MGSDFGDWYIYYKGCNLLVNVLHIILLVALTWFEYYVIRYGLTGQALGKEYLEYLQEGDLAPNLYHD